MDHIGSFIYRWSNEVALRRSHSLLTYQPFFQFLYERVLRPTLEKRIKETVPDIPGWDTEITVFSSGMAAISADITVLRHKKDQYHRDNTHTLRLDMFDGYFETLALLDLLNSSDLNC
jgi:hypothetical protein